MNNICYIVGAGDNTGTNFTKKENSGNGLFLLEKLYCPSYIYCTMVNDNMVHKKTSWIY